jgi:hypothetical protein
MYQDVAGTSPVTADGQSVLLMLDKGQWGGRTLSQVLAAQPELVTNGGFDTASDWDEASGFTDAWSISGGKAVMASTSAYSPFSTLGQSSFSLEDGAYYLVTFDVDAISGIMKVAFDDNIRTSNTTVGTFNSTGSKSFIGRAGSGDTLLLFARDSGTASATIDNISVKRIPGYHRVQATPSQAPKYKTDGTLHWLLYDGTDDGNVTPTINWGTDEVAICAGITKSSDAAAGVFAELSASSSSNNGTFALFAPVSAAANYSWRSKGTGDTLPTASPYAAPTTNVLTGQGKIAADLSTLRADGAQVGTSATDQGTGNFGNYPMYFGRRGGSSLPFNGKEHQFIARSRLLSASELAKLETFVAAKTGVIL